MSEEPSKKEKFYLDLYALQDKYPMCYIEAWNPDDWQQYLTPEKTEGKDEDNGTMPADWDDPDHEAIVEGLKDSFDANHGTNWFRLQYIVGKL